MNKKENFILFGSLSLITTGSIFYLYKEYKKSQQIRIEKL